MNIEYTPMNIEYHENEKQKMLQSEDKQCFVGISCL